MGKLNSVLVFSIFLLILVVSVALVYFINERGKIKAIGKRFRTFKKGHILSNKDLRAVPRILIPESMEVILTLKQNGQALRAHVVDISLSGLSVKTNISLKRITLDSMVTGARVATPINCFDIRALKLIRKDRMPRGRFMAFFIYDIEENQFEELKLFLKYLDDFLAHEQNKN